MRRSGAARDGTCVYLLRVSHPEDLERLCVFLRRVRLHVKVNDDGTLTCTAPEARTPMHERREINGYVTTWNALNPASPVTLVEAGP
jgi:hypothetical protein